MADGPRQPEPGGHRDGEPVGREEPGHGGPAPLPPVGGAQQGNWFGRARVPARPAAPVDGSAAHWVGPDDREPGRWWMPIVIGLVALLLLGLLTYGLWLITAAQDGEPGRVTPTGPATAPPVAPATTPPRTTARPSPTRETERIVVPDLVGFSVEEAKARLEHLGLTYRLGYQVSFEDPGTVLETDPEAGIEVGPGEQVRLTVAQALLPTGRPTPAPTASGG